MKTTKLFNELSREFKLNMPYTYIRENGFKSIITIKEFKTDGQFEFIIGDFESDISYEKKTNQVLLINQLCVLRKYKQAG